MNISPRLIVLLSIAAVLVGGCGSAEVVLPHTPAQPGPWQGVKVSTPFSVSDGMLKVQVVVQDYATNPADFVRKFDLVDQTGRNVGQRVFAYGDDSRETFILDSEVRELTLTITSTGRGQWCSDAIKVPPLK